MPEPVVQMCLFTTGKKHEADMKSLINTYIYIYNHVYKTSARKPTNFWDRQPIAKKGEVICLLQVHDGLKGLFSTAVSPAGKYNKYFSVRGVPYTAPRRLSPFNLQYTGSASL